MLKKSTLLVLAMSLCFAQCFAQDNDQEIADVFDGIDVTTALDRVKEMGVTPYDFGFRLLRSGHPDKAKEWYVAVGIKTKDLQYVYGLAWMKWVTGDNRGAMDDAKYVLARKPSPLIKARTYYLLGAVSVDEYQFKTAKQNLEAGLKAYGALGKDGGQYLCTSMLAMCAVYERNFDDVEPLLEKADMFNEAVRAKGKKAYPKGRHYEILSEMRYAQGDFEGALIAAQDSAAAYREGEKHHLADEVEAKIGLLLLLTGEPRAAKKLASKLWEKHHLARDRGRLLAYNSITLMKLSLCSANDQDATQKESEAREWAQSGPGGKALVRLLEWTKDEKNFPCPMWR
jgi:tetratricopeptide (TPR) repeat protein